MRRLACVVTVFGLLVAACGTATQPVTTTVSASPTVPDSTPTTIKPPAETTITVAETTTIVADTGPATFKDRTFTVSYTMIKPEHTTLTQAQDSGDMNVFEGRSGANEVVIFTTRGPSTLDDWRASQVGSAITVSDGSTEVDIGGATGEYLEFTTQQNTTVPGEIGFIFAPGDTGRVYMVDVDGETVTIIGAAGPDLWPDFQFELDELIAGLTWD